MGWFDNKDTMQKKSALRNAVAVMLADGKVEPNEVATLGFICKRLGLEPSVLNEIVANPGQIEFVVPQDPTEKVRQLADVVFMMMADGNINQKELDCCRAVALGLGFSASTVVDVILGIAEAIKNGVNRDQTIRVAENILGKSPSLV